jgi:hypothetical protein
MITAKMRLFVEGRQDWNGTGRDYRWSGIHYEGFWWRLGDRLEFFRVGPFLFYIISGGFAA